METWRALVQAWDLCRTFANIAACHMLVDNKLQTLGRECVTHVLIANHFRLKV